MSHDDETDDSVKRPVGEANSAAKPPSVAVLQAEERRRKRSAEQLRANLARRKVQARARRAGEEDERDGKLATPNADTSDT